MVPMKLPACCVFIVHRPGTAQITLSALVGAGFHASHGFTGPDSLKQTTNFHPSWGRAELETDLPRVVVVGGSSFL